MIILISIIFDLILRYIKDCTLYFYGLTLISYTRYALVNYLENALYKITSFSQRIPYLIYKPLTFKIQNLNEENAINPQEKKLILIEKLICRANEWIGIRIAYIAMLIIFIGKNYEIQITTIINSLKEINYISKFENIYQYINKNGHALLVVIIIALSLYICHIKRKFKAYKFEEIWFKDEQKIIIDVAHKQTEILEMLLNIREPIKRNCLTCCDCIKRIDFIIANLSEDQSLPKYNFEDYFSTIEEIKERIRFIEVNYGNYLFTVFNKDAWFQLYLLEMLDSQGHSNHYGIGACSKQNIEYILRTVDLNKWNDTRKSMLSSWAMCIYVLNGIQRYLYYISKRKRKFYKLYMNLDNITNIKELISDIK